MSRLRLIEQSTAPDTPGTGELLVYADSSGRLATKDDAGVVRTAPGLEVANTFSAAGTFSSTLAVTGAATLSSTLGVTGATTLSSTLGVTGAATFNGTVVVDTVGAGTALTIASDAVTVTKAYHTVDTEAAAATDNLATISGGAAGNILILATANSARDVTVKHGTGNIFLDGAADFTLSDVRDKLMLIRVGTEWHEIGRGNNT